MGLKTTYYQLFHWLSCLIENEIKSKINSSNELLKKVHSLSLVCPLYKFKLIIIDNKCFLSLRSIRNSNILGLGDVKQIVNTPTVIEKIMNKITVKAFILRDLMNEQNHLLSMINDRCKLDWYYKLSRKNEYRDFEML